MTEPVYPTSVKWYAKLNSTWTDLSAYVLERDFQQTATWGMQSNAEDDRIASLGTAEFSLLNNNGQFDPDSSTALSGWDVGTKVVLRVVYDGADYVRFYGAVSHIGLNDNTETDRTVSVSVLDWMKYTSDYPLKETSIVINQTGDAAVDTITGLVPVAPLAESYDKGVFVFDALFDTVTRDTKANTELNKIVMSEGGYFYKRCDHLLGETLVFESNARRSGLVPISRIPALAGDLLLQEDGTSHILQEDGTSHIQLNKAQDAQFTGAMIQSIQRSRGEKIFNRIKITARPKRVDTTEQVLFSLDTPIKLGGGQTKTFVGVYSNPEGGSQVNAITDMMVQPVATTDYKMYQYKSGTGTNLTSSLVVTVVYGSEAPTYTLFNSSSAVGWVTLLQARGYGVYQDNEISVTLEDATSQTSFGVRELSIDQQYQRDIEMGQDWAAKLLSRGKNPHSDVDSITILANVSSANMFAFLTVDIGDLIKVAVSEFEVSDYYYVQGVKLNIFEKGVIVFTWILKRAPESVLYGTLTGFAAEFTASYVEEPVDATPLGIVNFGFLPHVWDHNERTLIMSVYIHRADISSPIFRFGASDTYADPFWALVIGGNANNQHINLIDYLYEGASAPAGCHFQGSWDTNTLPNTWYRLAVTQKRLLEPSNNALFYRNGVAATTILYTPDWPGYRMSEAGYDLNIGGYRGQSCPLPSEGQPASPYYNVTLYGGFDGLIKNVKYYNRILTAAEIAAEYAGTAITDGLVFHAFHCKTSRTAEYYDQNIAVTVLPIIDTVHGAVGWPLARIVPPPDTNYGTVIGREI